MSQPDAIRFYWSLRSPYAWFAVHRVERMLEGLPVTLEWIPVFPPPTPEGLPNNPTNFPAKIRYIWEDSQRFANAYGLTFKKPDPMDTDWARPHTAFLYADSEGRGPEFAKQAFAARFSLSEDLADDRVLADIAARAELEPEKVIAAADDPAYRERLGKGFAAALRDEIFGVPTFIYRDQMFFGNDRLEWLVEAIQR